MQQDKEKTFGKASLLEGDCRYTKKLKLAASEKGGKFT